MTTPYGPAAFVDEIHTWLKGRPELDALRLADLDLAPNTDPPMIVVGPPTWTPLVTASGDGGPFRYRLTVWVVEPYGPDAATDRAFRDLMDHCGLVARALDIPEGIRITEARPTSFPVGGTELPAYAIDIEVTG